MKLKVIQVTASYKPAYVYGGPIQSVGKLCEALEEVKAKRMKIKAQKTETIASLKVFTTTANGKEELPVKVGKSTIVDGVPVTYFKRWTKDHSHFSPGLLWGLRKEILRCAQDDRMIVHIHAWWNLVSVLSCFIAKWYNIPAVLSPRGMLTAYSQNNRHSYFKRLIHLLIGKRLLEYCHIHTTSEQEKSEVLKIVKPKSIEVIWNLVGMEEQGAESKEQGTDSKEQEANSKDTQITFKLIFLSRIEQKKGLELLFDALAEINIPWTLTIAGSGVESYVESLKTKAESLKLDDRINWIGHVPNENKFQILANHDLLVLPSYNENFANVVVESLSVGTPVLLSNKVGLAEYVKTRNMGWISDLNPYCIAQWITIAKNSSALRKQIRENAPAIISENFKDDLLALDYVKLYHNVIA